MINKKTINKIYLQYMSYTRLTPTKEYPLPHGYGSNIQTNN